MPAVANLNSTFTDGQSYIVTCAASTVNVGGAPVATVGDVVLCRYHYYDGDGYRSIPGFATISSNGASSKVRAAGRQVAMVGTMTDCGHTAINSGVATINAV